MKKILVIYPDWNVTKIALFEGENKLLEKKSLRTIKQFY